jgi:hypothetical protein
MSNSLSNNKGEDSHEKGEGEEVILKCLSAEK